MSNYCEDCPLYYECCETIKCCNKAYTQGRTDTIDKIIKTLSQSEDTILSDRQYYELLKLKQEE